MYCENCGNELTSEFAFCTNCGHKIEVSGKDEGVGLTTNPSHNNERISSVGYKPEDSFADVPISTVPNPLPATPESASQPMEIYGDNSLVRIALSVLLGVVLFAVTALIIFVYPLRPGHSQSIVSSANIWAFLDKETISADIAKGINADPLFQLDVDAEDISEFLARDEVSEKLGEAAGNYVDAIALGDYEYHLTPKETTSLLKSLSSEFEEEFDYKLTNDDYERISASLKDSDALEQYSAGKLLADAKVSNAVPYVLFSNYLLLFLGAVCVLLLFDILFVNRRSVRAAFFVMGIPFAITGIFYIASILLSEALLNALSGGSIYMILSLLAGATPAFVLPALISLVLGVLAIGAYLVIRKVKKNCSPRPKNHKKVWRIVGLGANLGMLLLCGALMFLCLRNLPETSAYSSDDIEDSLEEPSESASPADLPSLSPQETQPDDMAVTFRDSDGNILLYKSHILNAEVVSAENDTYGVQLSLTEEGRQKFQEATKKVAGMDDNRLTFYIGESVVLAPVVDKMYATSGIDEKNPLISGNMSREEAEQLVALIVSNLTGTEAQASGKINVPSLIGMQMEDAERVLKALGLSAKLLFVNSGESLGVVLEQDVSSGVSVDSGTEVLLEVSLGNERSFAETAPAIAGVSASSELASQILSTETVYYYATNVIDGSNSTAWCEGASGNGIGESLTFSFDEKTAISAITLKNGYWKSQDSLKENGRIKQVIIDFNDGTSETLNVSDPVDMQFSSLVSSNGERITFAKPHNTDAIKITISDVYAGSKYSDTCITGVSFECSDSATSAYESDADYILPNSSVQALTEDDLKGLSKEELRLARNEVYARYGRQFNDTSLQEYFNTKSWYAAIPKLPVGTDPALSELELANVDLIKAYEAR